MSRHRAANRWTAAEDLLLRTLYPAQGGEACARGLPHRSIDAIYERAKKLGLYAPGRWTEPERAVLREHYPAGGTAACLPLLPGRARKGIEQQARKLGLSAPPECLARHRFKPGHKPWNTGLKGYQAGGRSRATRFKPGQKPHTWHPIGHERWSNEGYLQRKLTDTGYAPRDYRPVHHLLWEQHHGPIPEGHVVAFRNGDRTDLRIGNLELISRAELLARNSVHRLPEPLRRVITAKARLTRIIGELSDEKQNRGSA